MLEFNIHGASVTVGPSEGGRESEVTVILEYGHEFLPSLILHPKKARKVKNAIKETVGKFGTIVPGTMKAFGNAKPDMCEFTFSIATSS